MIRIDHLDIRSYAEAISDQDRADKLILSDEVIEEPYKEQQARLKLEAENRESFPAPGSSQDAKKRKNLHLGRACTPRIPGLRR